MEYYLVYIRRLGSDNDRYNLVKATNMDEAEEKIKNIIVERHENLDNYFIQAQKTIE